MSVLELVAQKIPEGSGLTMESIARFMVYGELPQNYLGEQLELDVGLTCSSLKPNDFRDLIVEMIYKYAPDDIEFAARSVRSNAMQILVRASVMNAGYNHRGIAQWMINYLKSALAPIEFYLIPQAVYNQLAICA